jgi:hypothetical protein
VLPAAEATLSFFCYSEQQAEQLQFSTWKVRDLRIVYHFACVVFCKASWSASGTFADQHMQQA